MKPLVLAALAMPALIGSAAGLHQLHEGMHAHIHGMLVQKLELTEEQQTTVVNEVQAFVKAEAASMI